jgi:hypothetical protein
MTFLDFAQSQRISVLKSTLKDGAAGFLGQIYPMNQADFGTDTTEYTVSIWWKPLSFENYVRIVMLSEVSRSPLILDTQALSGIYRAYSVGIWKQSDHAQPSGRLGFWHHLAAVK